MGEFFISNNYMQPLYKHRSLPVYITDEFDFYRCIHFEEKFYGTTVQDLHAGNLRPSAGRYSKLFPNQKISYWADSPITARAEIKKHGADNNILTFWAYDDASSSFPINENGEKLVIVDGRKCGIQEIINRIDDGKSITAEEEDMMKRIIALDPDCVVYDSVAHEGGENYIFLEKGFRKLAIRELRLRLGERKSQNSNRIICASTSDYSPRIDNYKKCFLPIVRIGVNKKYIN